MMGVATPLRMILMGTGPFAVPTFRRILEGDDEVALIVTRPVPAAVGKVKAPVNPVADLAEDFECELFQPASINAPESIARLREISADLFVVCDYGQILSRETLSASRLGGINLHGSLLPRHRGAAPVQWAILSGDTKSGVSVIHMTPLLDGGPVITERITPIHAHETAESLEQRLAELGIDATLEAIDLLRLLPPGESIGRKQDPALTTKAPRFSKSDGWLDWTQSASRLSLHVRAMQPWPGSFGELLDSDPAKNTRIVFRECEALPDLPGNDANAEAPGTIVEALPSLIVKCGSGRLKISRLQPAGKREMTSDEFVRGKRIAIGDRFSTKPPAPSTRG